MEKGHNSANRKGMKNSKKKRDIKFQIEKGYKRPNRKGIEKSKQKRDKNFQMGEGERYIKI